MHLINTENYEIVYHINCPKGEYAILSHTWEDEEVTFQDFKDLASARKKKGFVKIQRTVRIARSRGLKWAWVDTCCIDKSSSAELSEAINSMYQWYTDSAICFAYLSDLPTEKQIIIQHPHEDDNAITGLLRNSFATCRWWTRGWTLQELIAPRNLDFYDKEWNFYGDKEGLAHEITSITRVSRSILNHNKELDDVAIAVRMSWAATRQTTRAEDTAYCLLGIFDINMPLLYGEGQKAFVRLQEEICKKTTDLSIFAWTARPPEGPNQEVQQYRGIFAKHPSEFKGGYCIQMAPKTQLTTAYEITLTNKGVRLDDGRTYLSLKYGLVMYLNSG
ncbi:heterokaryon incompatibility protein-domain-containing protein [Xylariales sp. AK1849]|nr:heterokaryon incompatibility protein-domain-containing protein [Xylariales sp. AK1849]